MYKSVKRFFDLLFSLIVIIISLPVTLIIALIIKLESKGPIFFLAKRVGYKGKEFDFIKFRTMRQNVSGLSYLTTTGDSRITKSGKVLRLLKFDELPQLINVLKGDMSIVGPRPEVPDIVYKHYIDKWDEILTVKPGLTCLLQVKVFPDFTYHHPKSNDMSQEDYYLTKDLPFKIQEDIEYVKRQSFLVDLQIIFQTIYCILVKSWKYI